MKKVIAISLILISIISAVIPSFAAYNIEENVNLYKIGDCGNLLNYKGSTRVISYVVYKSNGKEYPAYCLNVDLPGAEKGSYNVSTLEKLNNNAVWKVIINGYPYKTLEELGAENEYEAYAATKQAVYIALYSNRKFEDYSAYNSDAGRRTYNILKKILTDAENCNQTEPGVGILNIVPLNTTWKVDSIDSTLLSKTYKVNSNIQSGTYKINLKGLLPDGTKVVDKNNSAKEEFNLGEEFKIIMPIQNLTQSESFTIEANANLNSYPILYGNSNSQDKQNYAITGLTYETKNATYTEDYSKNLTKIVVYKQEYGTKTPLKGVKFQLLDSNKNIVKDNLITDGKGQISLENLIPGKYFLKETETLEGYNLYTDLIEINLDLNEEVQVTINNTRKTVTEINKNYEVIEVVSNKEESKIISNTDITNIEKNETEITEENNIKILNETEIIKENDIKIVAETTNVKKLPKTGF
jgi:hypothetical protein